MDMAWRNIEIAYAPRILPYVSHRFRADTPTRESDYIALSVTTRVAT